MDDQTRRILDFLSNPASYPHGPRSVVQLQTHASWVFIASPFVCKIKKPVDFGFLNFTTLERRRRNCEDEVRLNRRLAPMVYLDVLAISETDDGLRLGPASEFPVVEWAVWMKELDSSMFLSHRLRDGSVTVQEMQRVADRLTAFYRSIASLPQSDAHAAMRLLQGFVHDNFRSCEHMSATPVASNILNAIETFTREFETRHSSLLSSRAEESWVRDCHGDLHSEHICLESDGVQVFDCLEFNTALRHIDVACDAAFLAMDLDFNGRHDLSSQLKRQVAVALEDNQFERLSTYYQCYRACVRGKVELLHSVTETAGPSEQDAARQTALRYFQLALRYAMAGTEKCVFAFMGRVASGKSFLAASLADAAGWPVVSSDLLRKAIAGIPPHRRGTDVERAELYSSEMSARVYDRLGAKAGEHLRTSPCVIVDATFSRTADRESLQETCRRLSAELIWVEAFACEAVTLERLRQRSHRSDVVSDAREEDYAALSLHYEPPGEIEPSRLFRIDTSSAEDDTVSELMQKLAHRVGGE